ncbi:hypothetical protein AAVH_17109 [Aphelenchoides avenae]|nr:hypothetical protein AAVH_17109 [Aphelenchus avenae]
MVSQACMDNLTGISAENKQPLLKLGASPEYYEAIEPPFSTTIKRYTMHLVAGGLVLLVLIAVMTACLLRQRLARRRMWMPNLEKSPNYGANFD